MKIKNLALSRLRNEEHCQFHSEFDELVSVYTPETLNISECHAGYQSVLATEKGVLNILVTSALTREKAEADRYRDRMVSGIEDLVKSSLNHFNPEVQQAALRLQVVLNEYGDIENRSYVEETAAIWSLTGRLEGDYADDVAQVGLLPWIGELKVANQAFQDLEKQRSDEEIAKGPWRMKDIRLEVDKAYRLVVDRINALIIVNGEVPYVDFVNEVNQRIENYANIIARNQGIRNRISSTD